MTSTALSICKGLSFPSAPRPILIVYAISHVTALLDFANDAARTDGVYGARLDEETVARFYGNKVQKFLYGSVLDFTKIPRWEVFLENRNKFQLLRPPARYTTFPSFRYRSPPAAHIRRRDEPERTGSAQRRYI